MLNSISVDEDAWLKLENQLCFMLHATSRLVTRAYAELLEDFELTYTQYLVLLVLWEWDRAPPDRTTVKALGERLELDSGTLTPLLRRLEEKQLIARERSREDGREVLVRVSTRGRALKRRVAAVPRQIVQNSPVALAEIIELRERLACFRSRMQAASDGSST